jgi:hypothetical protein
MLQVLIIIPPISIFLCKRLAAEKKRREAKAKEKMDKGPNKKRKKEKKDIYAAMFPFIFKI